ncbi:transcription factor bHLH91-like [Senna tora]|uniref:Transcription factor bHLH91-like n=1 Tax=Senna tora TaxID=362788 RepID=A0A834TX11_9FABA|nr:transcription factor bHLH91-like [Senna tora]
MYDQQITGFPQMVHSHPPPEFHASLSTTTNTSASAATSALFIMEENSSNGHTHVVEMPNHNHCDSNQLLLSKWDTSDMQNHHHHHHQNQDQLLPYPTPDYLNLLYSLPTSTTGSISSFVNSSSISFEDPSGHGGLAESTNVSPAFEDPFLHLNLPAHPPALRDLFQSLPTHGYNNILPAASKNDHFMILGGEDDREEGSGVVAYLDADGIGFGNNDNGVLKFSHGDLGSVGRKGGRGGKRIKQVNTEKQRRVEFSSKFDALRELIPCPTKTDRASVVGDAIDYIRMLLRSVKDLKLLVDKKRREKRIRIKRHKLEEDEYDEEEEETLGDMESCNLKPLGESDDHHPHPFNGCLIRSSWLSRKSKDTEVDVRIIDDEVTIKLVQRKKKMNCLLYASKAMDELELDLQHVAGGHIGDFCSFLFNSKIYEGSSVYASAIANKLIEVMDGTSQAA